VSALLESSAEANHSGLLRYYRRHAPLNDLTRWTFLFGRARLLNLLEDGRAPLRVLESAYAGVWEYFLFLGTNGLTPNPQSK
jgi:hypothetical protein